MFEHSFFTFFTSFIGFFGLLFGAGFVAIKILEMEWNYRSGIKKDLQEIRDAVEQLKARDTK